MLVTLSPAVRKKHKQLKTTRRVERCNKQTERVGIDKNIQTKNMNFLVIDTEGSINTQTTVSTTFTVSSRFVCVVTYSLQWGA